MIYKKSNRIEIKDSGTVHFKTRDDQSKIYAPKHNRNMLINSYHNEYTHPGYKKTLYIIRRLFNWLSCKFDVIDGILKCQICKTAKHSNKTLYG